MAVTVVLAGDFAPTDTEAAERLKGGFDDLANTSTGRLLGLHEPVTPPRVRATAGQVELRVELDLGVALRGLRDAVSGEVWQIFDLPSPKRPSGRFGEESATPE